MNDETIKPGVQISLPQSDGTYMVMIWAMDDNDQRTELIAVADSGLTHDAAEARCLEVVAELEEMAVA